MNVQHKLEGFMETALKEASEKQEQILQEINKDYNSACDEIRKKAEKSAEERYKSECYQAEQIKNKEIISASTEVKRAMVELRSQFLDGMFDRVLERLKAFTQSDEYEEYLISKIMEIQKQNPDSTVYLRSEDMVFADKIAKMTGMSVIVAEDDLIGGFKLKIKDKNAIIDNSFKTGLAAARQNNNTFKITD